MARQLKEMMRRALESRLSLENGFVAITYQGLDSEKTYDLRRSLREAGGTVFVVPNRLVKRVISPALGQKANNGQGALLSGIFKGPTALVYSGKADDTESVFALSRAVVQWRKKNEDKIEIKGGLFSGALVDSVGIERLASMPDRHTLFTQVASLFQSPLRNMATVTQQVLARVVYALNAYKEKLEKEGGGGS